MREIKFRGKRKDTGKWVFGSLVNSLYKHEDTGEPVTHIVTTDNCDSCFNTCDSDEEYFACEDCFVEVDPATVGQYIGLKDKNGREIYEGDIIFRPNEVGRIEFSEDGSFLIRFPHHLARLNATWEPIEVIGNIHDNPELLEAES